MQSKLFKRLFLGFGTSFAILIPGLAVARANGAMINHAFNINGYKVVDVEETDPNVSIYFNSNYNSLEEVKAAGSKLVSEIEEGGLVLLKNDNNALPLTESAPKVSLFGNGSVSPNYTPSLSGGSVNVNEYKTLKQALESVNCSVNGGLWDYYVSNKSTYGRKNSVSGLVKTYTINEIPWSNVSTANGDKFANYGDAAIVTITRDSGEGFDLTTKGSDGRNGMYLGLSNEEIDL